MLARGKYNIEWVPRPQDDRQPSGLKWIVALVAAITLISFSFTLLSRFRARSEEPKVAVLPAAAEVKIPPKPSLSDAAVQSSAVSSPVAVENGKAFKTRPQKLRNLLLRLQEAEKDRNTVMAITTIESIRQMPEAADLDNALARRLGTLNFKWLFEQHNPQWVAVHEVRRGDSASRIASEHGSTFASLKRLNGGNLDKVLVGAKLFVLDHPRFALVVHRQLKYADLQLKGKFFRRYDLKESPTVKEGAYTWGEVAAKLAFMDRSELDLLLSRSTVVAIAEL